MRIARVSEIRARLTAFLDIVRNGGEVEIHERGVPIARFVPIEPSSREVREEIPAWLKRQARAGVIRLGTMDLVPGILKKRPPGSRKARVLDALLEERRTGR